MRLRSLDFLSVGEKFDADESLFVFLLLQRRRTLLFFYGFLDESDDLALFG
jgi:hypothetical protein